MGIQSFNNLTGVFTGVTITGGIGVTVTNGNGQTGNPTISISGGGISVEHLTGNSGGTLNPDGSNNFNTLGTGSITVAGSGSTLTTQLTGLTNHAVLVGAGTATITNVGPTATAGQVLQSGGSSADPVFSTATYPSTTTINQILYSSATNVVGALATANQGVLTTGTTGIPVITALATNGQLIIGSTAGAPAAATLTQGAGITITNASNSITIAGTGSGGFVWQTITASQTLVKFNGYMCISAGGALALALPSTASSTIGDTIIVTLDGATSWSITQAASQQIQVSSAQTTSGATGSVTTTARGDSITLVYQATGRWNAYQFTGNLTVA
jgi:hypothetical protein